MLARGENVTSVGESPLSDSFTPPVMESQPHSSRTLSLPRLVSALNAELNRMAYSPS